MESDALTWRQRAYLKNGEKWRAAAKLKRQSGNDWYLVKKEYYKKYPEKYLLNQAKKRAKQKGLPFNLEESDIVIPKFCPIFLFKLGEVYSPIKERDYSPSVDRIIPDLGYVKGNIEIISFKANRHKSAMSLDDIERLYKYSRRELNAEIGRTE